MKLLRWTVGNCSGTGMEILEESVKWVKRLYPELRLMLCYNHESVPDKVRHLGVELYRQSHSSEMEYPPKNEIWKLYPPRLNPDGHEIFMDNDVVMVRRCEEVEKYLESDSHALLYEGVYGVHGKYPYTKDGIKVNSGIFGLPPGFDFAGAIKELQKNDRIRDWEQKWDDQGVVGSILSRMPYFFIRQAQVPCCGNTLQEVPQKNGLHVGEVGFHFVDSNHGNDSQWKLYKRFKKVL